MITNKQRLLTDDDFDENGVLKDLHRFRVPMRLMDRTQRATALDSMRLHDGMGNAAGHKPGYVFGNVGASARDAAAAARAEYVHSLETGWMKSRPAEAQPVAASSSSNLSPYEEYKQRLANAWRRRR